MRSGFLLPLLLVVVGTIAAGLVQTNFGDVTVRDLRFAGSAGNVMSGLLYVPDTASQQRPAAGVLAVHGYINSRETQSAFAIELARRGYVVLALDQTGHGYSDAPAFAHGFGGPDGLKYLRSLPFVDTQRIGLAGHSMGGWTVLMAADAYPDDYQSIVLMGSSTGTLGTNEGTATWPRNLLLIFSLYDEFAGFMWASPKAQNMVNTDKLKTLFGVQDTVVVGQTYGDMDAGTARRLTMPPVTHPGDHLSTAVVSDTLDWFAQTLGADRTQHGQIWFWKELATMVALVGLCWLLFPLLAAQFHQRRIHLTLPDLLVLSTTQLRVLTGLSLVVPVVVFFPAMSVAGVLPANSVFPQQITNGVILWALVSSGLCFICLAVFAGRVGYTMRSIMPLDFRLMRSAAAIAIVAVGAVYMLVLAAEFLLLVDFRFWVVALKRLSTDQFFLFLIYLPLFGLYFVLQSLLLHSTLAQRSPLGNGLMMCVGFVVLLLVQYVPLFLTGSLAIASQPLFTIVAIQFVPLLFLIGFVSTVCFERTGNIYVGTFVNTLFVTWYVVAGTATQTVPFFS